MSFPIQKISLRFFGFLNANFGHDFPEKRQKRGGVISDLKNFVANLMRFGPISKKNRNIFFRKRAGGAGVGQRPFGNFPEIHRYWKRRASLRVKRLKSTAYLKSTVD